MALTLILILFGAGLGGFLSGLLGLYFVATRAYRRVGNKLIIGFGRIFITVASVGSLLLLTRGLGALGVTQHFTQSNVGLYAYAASFVCGAFLVGWSEIRWRRSVGLHDKTLLPTKLKE